MTSTATAEVQQESVPRDHDGGDLPRGGVVVGYDGSSAAVEAVTWAAAEARALGAPLTVLHAVDFHGTSAELLRDLSIHDLEAQVAAQARRIAEEGARIARDGAPTPVQAVSRLVSPVDALVEASRRAALVVVGNRGRGTLRAALLGSVAFGTSARASSPVLVLRRGTARTPDADHPVVVGADGSPSAERALDVAADLAARTGAVLQPITAWTVPPVGPYGAVSELYAPELHALAGAASAAATERARQRHPDLVVDARVVQDQPVRALGAASQGAGRVVVGSQGHGRVLGAVLGSVSQGAVHACACPVEVVRPDPV
ncbi:universal stress protein [uncultured Pseudokineococcus sp.]|uniref:universal stress protein n=1 Tax=uncultured Pseudokineococcus sp. TaxID=1642928 RepID=UPI00263935D4|nr:universal stress protein [uncultured Pseudokineococcus sp.]